MKKGLKIFLVIFITLVFILIVFFIYVKELSKPLVTGQATEEVRIEIPDGMSVYKAALLLKKENLIKNARLFYYSARYPFINKILYPKSENISFTLRSGIYHIKNNMNMVEIQKQLSSGQQEYIRISIPEGYTISQIAEELENNKICSALDFKSVCKSEKLRVKYNIPGDSCEGYLFPDTYFLTAGMQAEDVATFMIDNFYQKIKLVKNLSQISSQDLFYVVRLASIVEKEYAVKEEAPLIASVFKNRLRRNIGLYSCATIVYIITEIEGKPHPDRILIEDTKIDSPYNTYKWAGLPPGAISNPGLVALDAATNTPKTNYYFFQVTDAAEGRHVFSENFEEQIENHLTVNRKAVR